MDFKQLAQTRESCRAYSDRPVDAADIRDILEAARLAPSACNSQPWKFIVCEGDIAKQMPDCIINPLLPFNKWTVQVPAFIVICETKAKLMGNLSSQRYAQLDIGIATASLCYAASDKGLSTCILGDFRENKVKALLDIPKNIPIRLIVTLGYAAAEGVREKKRKDFDEIATYSRW